jgi:hypothetical protein
MALITTSLTPEVVYNPFRGLPEQARAISAIPRAEVYVTVDAAGADNWPAPGSGNVRRLRIIHTLDTNYAYVVVSAHLKATSSTAYVAADGYAELAITASSKVYYSTALESYNGEADSSSATTAIGSIPWREFIGSGHNKHIRLMELRQKQTGMIFPFNDVNSIPSVNLSWYESIADGVAYDVGYNLRLLQFDVDQAYNYLVNAPNLVR